MNGELLPVNSRGIRLDQQALAEHGGPPNRAVLEGLSGRSILGTVDLQRDDVIELCRLGVAMESVEIAQHHPLDGKLVITAFFEASTRTRLSFESAVLRLDGKVVSVADGKTTGVAKGESLEDIGEMFNGYGDLVVMRHPKTESIRQVTSYMRIPLINAGNGSGEHPTQSLVDWYALLKWKPQLADAVVDDEHKIQLGVVGTPGSMRAVKSFIFLALQFAPALRGLTVVSELVDPFGQELQAAIRHSGVDVHVTNDLSEVLPTLDVVYMNSLALLGDTYKKLDSRYRITQRSRLRPGAVVMHPLARREELPQDLDDTEHNLYFAQALGAVYVRQALLTAVLGRLDRLPDLWS